MNDFRNSSPWSKFGSVVVIPESISGLKRLVDEVMQMEIIKDQLVIKGGTIKLPIVIFDTAGRIINSTVISKDSTTISLPNMHRQIIIIKIGTHTIKTKL